MTSIAHAPRALGPREAEFPSAVAEILAGLDGRGLSRGLRQVGRGLCLAVVGFGVILSVTAVLIGIQELGATGASVPLPPGQVHHR